MPLIEQRDYAARWKKLLNLTMSGMKLKAEINSPTNMFLHSCKRRSPRKEDLLTRAPHHLTDSMKWKSMLKLTVYKHLKTSKEDVKRLNNNHQKNRNSKLLLAVPEAI
jgi:hypothetical protein